MSAPEVVRQEEKKDEPTAAWVNIQQRTFTKWMNNHLRRKGFPAIVNAQEDFTTGINLMNLVNALFPDIPIAKYNKAPKMRPHLIDNCSLALSMVEAAKIKTNFLKVTHLVDKDLKMILGMIWAIILHYQIAGISVDELTAKEGLLLWCQKKTAGYRDVDPPGIKNFSNSWSDGMALCALIHKHRPDLIPYDSLDKSDPKKNLELAFSVAEKDLDIPRLLEIEDLTDVAKPDERAVMTYISEFFHKFASYDLKERSGRRIKKFANFNEDMEKEEGAYESGAKKLLAWIDDTTKKLNSRDFGTSYENAKKAFDQFKEYITRNKPEKDADRMDLEGNYVKIQTKLRVNSRVPWNCPKGISPEELDAAWGRLLDAERERGKAVRENMYKFITKSEASISQEKLDEFAAAFKHFDKDLDDHLDPVEFKAALAAIGIPFKDEAAFNAVFSKVSEGHGKINKSQFVGYMSDLESDTDTPEQIKESFKTLADGDSSRITIPQLNVVPLTDSDRTYLGAKMPSSDGRHDYVTYTDSSFRKD
eukprot:TRINITY_DN550_c0_g1_i4.p2 TRINITY_DN550_c0_g1~~TRINITY_DN550_c0_g1_i4.p2  ORF type:complete len:549 (-),score=199.24 TRINITY_DN550_c0_g1_i4:93-1691(-)